MKLSTVLLAGGLSIASAFSPPAFLPRSQTALNVAVGDSIPAVVLDKEFPPDKVDLAEYAKDKSLLVIGYLEKQDALKEAGIDEVIVWCVNDGAVMSAWADDQGVRGSMIKFLGDPSGALTKELDVLLEHPGPNGKGLFGRCKRHALYVVDGVVKAVNFSEAEDDPAGDDDPSNTMPDAMLEAIKSA